MTSAPSNRPASSLSESWATLSNSDAHSEDEWRSEHTDNMSLVGHSVADDVASLGSRDLESDIDSEDTESHCSESRPFLPPIYREAENNFENEHKMQASFMSMSESIVFDEPDYWPSTEVVELKHTVQVLDKADALRFGVPFDIGQGDLAISVQQSVSKKAIDVEKPFRVLYIGNPMFKSNVLDKLGDVLVTSPKNSVYAGSANSSRFHVVPASFGPDATPNYAELLPIHVQLVVEEAVSAEALAGPRNADSIGLSFKDREPVISTRTDSGFQLISASSWVAPDITIFFVRETEDISTYATRNLAFTFMERHNIPAMVISESPLWGGHDSSISIDPRTLHICLESRDPGTGSSKVVGRYPIDLVTFENISPAQLNRNLASLAGIHPKEQAKLVSLRRYTNQDGRMSDIAKYGTGSNCYHLLKDGCNLRTMNGHILGLIIGIAMICLCCTGLGTLLFALFKYFAGFANVSVSIAHGKISAGSHTTLIPSTKSNSMGTSLLPKSNAVVLSSCAKDKSLSVNDDILKLTHSKPNNTDKFQVYVVGDCHVIIKVPTRISSMRKVPKFEVKITKADTKLDFHLSKLFDNVYTLRLAREDAHGVMNVTISAKAKPLVEQITEVDFGTPWLKIASWKKAAQSLSYQLRNDLTAAQAGISEAYYRVFFDLQSVSDTFRAESGFGPQASIKQILKAACETVSKAKRYSEEIQKESSELMKESSRLLREQAQIIAKETTEIAHGMFSKVQQHAKRARQSALNVDLTQLKRTAERATKSQSLAAAQKQAFHLARDARLGWRKPKRSCNGKSCSAKGIKQR
ncbi:hypothetical protein D8B26_007633 [Coccidioides posadasii str. Silveira]|uniref:Uncharacterized protein n=1 Tax=Coccidioides posadasii (strain RMSCC 757 / Silveira) TaxID=443226 RepID=E9D2I7_COCPS|nr:conserved hypothetical protein [Coccidioides posadasii str. Silveira]QVM13017.1 hypothetical protein D8B26_007633 [Coccidioides posadasii str. Silveira]